MSWNVTRHDVSTSTQWGMHAQSPLNIFGWRCGFRAISEPSRKRLGHSFVWLHFPHLPIPLLRFQLFHLTFLQSVSCKPNQLKLKKATLKILSSNCAVVRVKTHSFPNWFTSISFFSWNLEAIIRVDQIFWLSSPLSLLFFLSESTWAFFCPVS